MRGVLLCGGKSARFGSDKLVATFQGEALASLSARHLLQGAGNALAVIPPGAAALRALLEKEGCEVLESQRCARGLGASLAAAVAATRDASGWLVALGDMPFISPATIAAVKAAIEKGADIAAPRLRADGTRGHPVGFSQAMAGELALLDGDEGARSLVQRERDRVVLVDVDDPGIVADIDVPGDLPR